MNVWTFTGNLGNPCRVAQVSGTTVCNFSVAAKSGFGQSAQTIWVDCALWGKQAESGLVQYLTKGQQVAVSGEVGTREHDGKTYVTVRVNQISLVGGKLEPQQGGQQAPQQGYNQQQAPRQQAQQQPMQQQAPQRQAYNQQPMQQNQQQGYNQQQGQQQAPQQQQGYNYPPIDFDDDH